MSGIAGMYDRTGQAVERALVHRMTTALRHRGPDAEGLWLAGPVGFGHRMLRTTPESLCDTQPLANATGTLCLTLDGRLDNRHELQVALKAKDINCQSLTDSELVLGAYTCWGERCVERLLGDFAFALWDSRRQTLFCARDHIGVKPFYYYVSDRYFLFGSEIKALLSVPHVPHNINEARIADYLVTELEGIDTTCTFYRAILRLPPEHTLTVCGDQVSVRSYWSLDPTQEISYRSQAEYTDAFQNVFTQAVECRLRGVSPVACMLSGGLDSSAIVGVARELLGKSGTRAIPTFSAISTEATNCVETSYIQAVLSLDKLRAHTVRPDQLGSFLTELEQIPLRTDDLFDNLIILPQLMYIAARRQGFNVVLDGVDGDLVASQGGSYLAYLLRAGEWRTALDEARGIQKVFDPSCSVGRLLLSSSLFALRPFVPARVLWLRRQLRHTRSFKQALARTLMNPDFARRIDLAGRLEMLWEQRRTTQPQTLREEHAANLNSAYIPVALERYDRVAATYSIEPRHPFFDKRLVEFCLALPREQKVSNGWSKILLRRAMAGLLPDQVRWRPGWEHLGDDFSAAFLGLEHALLKHVVRGDSDDSGDMIDLSEYVDGVALRQAYQRYVSCGSFEAGEKVWQAVTLALWLRRVRRRVTT